MKNTDLTHIEEFKRIRPWDYPEVIKILEQTVELLNKYLNPGKIEEDKIPDSVARFKDMFLREPPRGFQSTSRRVDRLSGMTVTRNSHLTLKRKIKL